MKSLYAPEKFFEELFGFRREFDEMFSRILNNRPGNLEVPELRKNFAWFPAVETYVDKEAKKYVCRFTLPGIEPKDVQVHAQNGLLTIRGERKIQRRMKETEVYDEEIHYGAFERTIALPEGVSLEKLNAEYVNGVLEITAPVTAAALPRKIEIKTSLPLSKQIAA